MVENKNNWNANDEALSWDDEIEKEGTGFELLEPGQYRYTITNFEKDVYDGSKGGTACPIADVTIQVVNPETGNPIEVQRRFFLTRSNEALLSAFFISNGQKKQGEPLKPNWGNLVGRTGLCEIDTREREYNGKKYKNNIVKYWLEDNEEELKTQGNWTSGKF